MSKIFCRYTLLKMEKGLVFQVLEMDEAIRGRGDLPRDERMRIRISSHACPELEDNGEGYIIVYLPGDSRDQDLEICSLQFDNNDQRDDAIERINRAMLLAAKSMDAAAHDDEQASLIGTITEIRYGCQR